MMGLPPRQLEVLQFLRTWIAAHGYPPTYRQIAAAIGSASPAGVKLLLEGLKERGYVTWEPRRHHSLRLATAKERSAWPDESWSTDELLLCWRRALTILNAREAVAGQQRRAA